MAGFLSLSDSLIELVGKKVIASRQDGVKEWCRFTTSCKRLWGMQLPGSAFKWSMNFSDDIKGATWMMQRVGSTRNLSIVQSSHRFMRTPLQLGVLHNTVKALITASRSLKNLTTLDLEFHEGQRGRYSIPPAFACSATSQAEYLQRWISALLLSSTKLTSLSMMIDGIPWPPVLGLLNIRHLKLTIASSRSWLGDIMTDLSFCSCLETLEIVLAHIDDNNPSMSFPKLHLQNVATLKSVQLIGWHPKEKLTLPPGCMLRMFMALYSVEQWEEWQRQGCPTSMLNLVCKKLQAWPAGIQEVSGLQFLDIRCMRMADQDLAALQHIPHVSLAFDKFSTLHLSSGSWQSLEIYGQAGFNITFSDPDLFVKGTARFLFVCPSLQAGDMFRVLPAACARQGVACHRCEHHLGPEDDPRSFKVLRLSNVKLCDPTAAVMSSADHEGVIAFDDRQIWPSRDVYPELYTPRT